MFQSSHDDARELAACSARDLISTYRGSIVPLHAFLRELARWDHRHPHGWAAAFGAPLDDLIEKVRAWEDLLAPRANESFDTVLARFRHQQPDPSAVLREFLVDAAAESKCGWYGVTPSYRRVVEALVTLGGAESFLLQRYSVLIGLYENDGAQSGGINALLSPHRDAFGAALFGAWPTFTWAQRATVTLLFSDNGLPIAPVLALLLDIDPGALSREEHAHYLSALEATGEGEAHRRLRAARKRGAAAHLAL